MRIEVNNFKGEMPRVAPAKLPSENATFTMNCRMVTGDLEPAWGLVPVSPIPALHIGGTIRGIFPYGNVWFSWPDYVDAINSPIANDEWDRVYFTGDNSGFAKVTAQAIATGSAPYPAADYTLGVPAPADPISASIAAPGDDGDTATDEDRAYVYTYVTAYGEEGPPSPVSNIVTTQDPVNDVIALAIPDLFVNLWNVTHRRIYRTLTTGDGTEFYLVAEVLISSSAFNDNVQSANLVTILDTEDFVPPPQNMKGMCLGANGIVAGYKGNEVIFSEPYLPYAYPLAYRHGLDYEVRGIKPTATGFVIGTAGTPYVIQGVHPNAMTQRKIEVNQACIGWRSMVDMGDFVIYASPDGLVSVTEAGALLITRDLFDRRQWQAMFNPAQIIGTRYEDNYVGFTSGGEDGPVGFVFNPHTRDFYRIEEDCTAAHNDLLQDKLFLVIGNSLYEYNEDEASPRTYTWRSKVFQTPDTSFSVVKLWTDEPAKVGFKLWADDEVVVDLPIMVDEAIRLPAARGTRWQFEVTGTARLSRVILAQSMAEVAG